MRRSSHEAQRAAGIAVFVAGVRQDEQATALRVKRSASPRRPRRTAPPQAELPISLRICDPALPTSSV